MALDPIVAEILLKGDDQLLKSLEEIGNKGSENLKKLAEAAEKGATPLATLGGSVSALEVFVSGLTAALVVFIEQQTELSQKTQLLAEAFGTTSGQLQELEAIFASSGVKVEQFERFANRLTSTIARQWPQISESIKTYATENDAATLRVSNAILRVHDAQNALADNSAERASRSTKDNEDIAASYVKLQFAAAHAASEQKAAQLSVQGATLGVEAAQQRLQTLEGNPPSDAAKQGLAIRQAELAVTQAQKAEEDAKVAQQEKAATASLNAAKAAQEYDDIQRRAAKNARDDAEQRQKDENAVKSAVIARAEAEDKAAKFALTNISSVKSALDGIVSGNQTAAKAINLTEVSVENLTKGIIAQAAAGAKGTTPTGYETLRTISNLLAADTGNLITKQERLAIVNRLAGTSMQALGASAAEILDVIENDSKAIEGLQDKVDSFGEAVPPKSIKEFRGALAGLNLEISQLSQAFAAAIAPAFTAFLQGLKGSLSENNGLIHEFIQGLKDIALAAETAFSYLNKLAGDSHFFDAVGGGINVIKAAVIGLGTAIVVAFAPVLAIPAAIVLVITAIGAVASNWDKIKSAASQAWDAIKDNGIVKFLTGVGELLLKILSYLGLIGSKKVAVDSVEANAPAQGAEGPTQAQATPAGFAGGGKVNGPGTQTSDSIIARLSRGEFVMKAQAVQTFGEGFMNAVNNGQFPGFAAGGLVSGPVRMGSASSVPASSTLNLSIDGRSFNGLRGPKTTVDDLSSFAIARQTSSGGARPSWQR